jgi:hypothetical protein
MDCPLSQIAQSQWRKVGPDILSLRVTTSLVLALALLALEWMEGIEGLDLILDSFI